MSQKSLVMLGLTIGGLVGSYAPVLWGASAFSVMSLFTGALGSILGVIAGYKIGKNM